jgi:hypothetical protein
MSVVYAKTKSSSPILAINSNIQYRPLPLKRTSAQPNENTTDDSEYDTELFETINLLSGLADGKKKIHYILIVLDNLLIIV